MIVVMGSVMGVLGSDCGDGFTGNKKKKKGKTLQSCN